MALGRKSSKEHDYDEEKNISIDAEMQGDLIFKDPVNLKINGNFNGSLKTLGTLSIGNKSEINANITGDNIVIAGKIIGDITANNMLVLMPTATLIGNISVKKLNIVEGAVFQGNCKMIQEPNKLDINEVSKYLEINLEEIEELANSGEIPGIKNGNIWEFERSQIDNWAVSGKLK